MKALAEPKTKPHHGPRSTTTHHSLSPTPSPGPPRRGALTNNNSRSTHERSHSDTHAVPVDLSAESSSVTSLSKLHKSHTSGMLLEPSPQPVGTSLNGTLPVHTTTSSTATVASSLSFVHAAACSALIASVRRLSTTGNNIRGTKPVSISNNSTPLLSVKHLRVKQLQKENKRIMLKSQQFSSSFDSSYSCNPSLCEHIKATNPPSVVPTKAGRSLKLVCKHDKFSRSLPSPKTSPSEMDLKLSSPSTSKFNLDITVDNDHEFETSTPTTEIVPLFGITNDHSTQNSKNMNIQSSLNDQSGNAVIPHYHCYLADECENTDSPSSQKILFNHNKVGSDPKDTAFGKNGSITNVTQKDSRFLYQNDTSSKIGKDLSFISPKISSYNGKKGISLPSQQETTNTHQKDAYQKGTFYTSQKDASLFTQKDSSFMKLENTSFTSPEDTSFTNQDLSFTSLKDTSLACPKEISDTTWRDISSDFQNMTSLTSKNELQNSLQKKKKIANANRIGIFQRIFRSKSEDVLSKDDRSTSNRCSRKQNTTLEVILSPVLTRSLFAKSHSEDFLDKAVDRPDVKKYSLEDSQCLSVKESSPVKIKRHNIAKSFQALLTPDPITLSTVLKKKMKFSKSHNFTNDEDVYLPSRFFLEKRLSCQDLHTEIAEKSYPTLQRFPNGKETHFPAIVKTVKSSKKFEAQRVYQVNQPKILPDCDQVNTEINRKETLHERVLTDDMPDPSSSNDNGSPLRIDGTMGRGKSENLSNYDRGPNAFQTFTKRAPWFEKFQKTRLKISCQQYEKIHCSDQLNDSFGSSVFSNASDDSLQENCLKLGNQHKVLPDNSMLSESVSFLSKYRGRPEVHKRVAEKLSSVIRELEEEMCIVPTSTSFPTAKVASQHYQIKKPYHSTDHFHTPPNIPVIRPASLPLDKQGIYRRNSAPMLSPIEEVKPSSLFNTSTKIKQPVTVSPFALGVHRTNSAPVSSPTKGNVYLLSTFKSRSLDESFGVQECIQVLPSNYSHKAPNQISDVSPSVHKNHGNQKTFHSLLPDEDIDPQPHSLVLPAPTTYCDQYGNENEIEYV